MFVSPVGAIPPILAQAQAREEAKRSATSCEFCLGQCVWGAPDRCIAPATKYDHLCDSHRGRKNKLNKAIKSLQVARESYADRRTHGTRNPARRAAKDPEVIAWARKLGAGDTRKLARHIVGIAIAADTRNERPLTQATVMGVGREMRLNLDYHFLGVFDELRAAVNYGDNAPWEAFAEEASQEDAT